MEETIIEEWETVTIPPPPEVKAVTVDEKETALLVLDIQTQNCNAERRPRCVRRLVQVAHLLAAAREHGVPVVYSLTRAAEKKDILQEVAPEKGEYVVKAGVDKFYQTELEKILKEKQIKTVIIVGTSAEGAVVHTATGAAARGYTVILPVDGISSGEMYAEQYTVWHMVHAPGTKRHVTVTKTDLITFE